MNAYGGFAEVYDKFMSDAPYDEWLSFVSRAVVRGTLPPLAGLSVADIGCGTGALAVELSSSCRRVVGVDLSEDMLAEAAIRSVEHGVAVSWLCQDVRHLQLPFAADLILSTCDSFNYLLTQEDWHQAFQSVRANLVKSGLFCFDTLGPQRIHSLRDGVWHDIEEDSAVFYETTVTDCGRIHYDVHAFVLEHDGNLYRRIEEEHLQQYVAPDLVCKWLEESGFEVQDVLGDFGKSEIARADRVAFTARA